MRLQIIVLGYLRCSKNPVEVFKQGNGIIRPELKEDLSYEQWVEWMGGGRRAGRPTASTAAFPVRCVGLNLSNG